jgi:hypothetical protein
MKNHPTKRKNNRKKMDYRRKMDYRKEMEKGKRIKIKNPAFSPKELRKKQANEIIKYPDYPQREGIPNLPLPDNISWELKILEARFFDQIDEFYPMAKLEILTQTQYCLLAGGVVNNFKELQLTEEIWNNGKSFADFISSGEAGKSFKILVAVNYRIHIEALRLITGKSLMDILYLGEISVQNELFDAGEKEFYLGVCKRILDMLSENPDLDLTKLSFKDLDAWRARQSFNYDPLSW